MARRQPARGEAAARGRARSTLAKRHSTALRCSPCSHSRSSQVAVAGKAGLARILLCAGPTRAADSVADVSPGLPWSPPRRTWPSSSTAVTGRSRGSAPTPGQGLKASASATGRGLQPRVHTASCDAASGGRLGSIVYTGRPGTRSAGMPRLRDACMGRRRHELRHRCTCRGSASVELRVHQDALGICGISRRHMPAHGGLSAAACSKPQTATTAASHDSPNTSASVVPQRSLS